MANASNSAPVENRAGYWRRVLRPLSWWLLLVLALFALHQHQLAMERTRLKFSVVLQGNDVGIYTAVKLDGQPAVSGQKIALGNHTLTVMHPKAEPFTTNFFGWYGGRDFGPINLKRATGSLSVAVNPPAPFLFIHGPEFNVELTNSPGITSTVPTDRYVIRSHYAHWSRSDEVVVNMDSTAQWKIAPRLGAAQITCNEADATGQLIQTDGRVIETVNFPYAITELPEGTYEVTARHHNDTLSQKVNITADTTNQLALEFLYGKAVLETVPPGAAVRTADGQYWGMTPLTATELKPGDWTFVIQHEGYETVSATLPIKAYESSSFRTNLISVNYTGSMKAARQAMDTENYDAALTSAGEALIAKPGDAEALTQQRNATGLGSLQRAKKLGLQGDFIGGQKELVTTLTIFPDNAEAKALAGEYKRREPEQREQMRLERLERGNLTFKKAFQHNHDTDLFASHEFKTTKPVDEVYAAILKAMKDPPGFFVTRNFSPLPETYQIDFKQEFSTYLATSAGYRNGVIVCAQTKDDETQILFKILEYKTEAQIKFSIGNLIGTPGAVNYVPISADRLGQLSEKLQARLNEGVTNVTARIQGAIGQTAPPSTQ